MWIDLALMDPEYAEIVRRWAHAPTTATRIELSSLPPEFRPAALAFAGKRPNLSPNAPSEDFVEKRRAICNKCKYNSEGICLVVAAKRPNHAVIESGIRRPEVRCPKGYFPAIPRPNPFAPPTAATPL